MFGRQSPSVTDPGATALGEQEERIMTSPGIPRPRIRENADVTGPVARTNQVGADGSAARWGVTEPVDAPRADSWPRGALAPADESATEPATGREPLAAPTRRTHTSAMATLSLIAGTLAVAAALTGLLAPLGFVAGVLAVLFSVVAIYAVRRPAVNGHALVGLGLVFGVVAVALSVLAMSHSVSWLSNRTDEITLLHNWLNDHIHWLRRW